MEEAEPLPQILSPCSSVRTSCADSNSPEFEFWMVRNPSFPQPNLLSADQLFSDGVLLPLHHLNLSEEASAPPPQQSGSDQPPPEPETSATESADLSATSSLTTSKRWRDIFRKNDHGGKEKDNAVKEKRREKKNGGNGNGAGNGAELNINIWPFSRSRSAGNGGTRPRSAAATRKVSSAPCSRSNSRGESKSKKWPSSPARAGVHLGRNSPVWQVRRSSAGRPSDAAAAKSAEKAVKKDGNEGRRKVPVAGGSKARVLSLNVPMCIGYRHQLSCRSDENSASVVAAAAAADLTDGGVSGEGVRGNNLFNIKSLFTRKVY